MFTYAEAAALMPEVRAREATIIEVRADLAELSDAVRREGGSPFGGIAEVKALEARLQEELGWFTAQGISVKSVAPLLIDFPGRLLGAPVLLCWLEGETGLAWYHRPELGFLGRRPLPPEVLQDAGRP